MGSHRLSCQSLSLLSTDNSEVGEGAQGLTHTHCRLSPPKAHTRGCEAFLEGRGWQKDKGTKKAATNGVW